MTSLPFWLLGTAAAALLLGMLLMLLGRNMRRRRGLSGGKTVSLDRVTLTSRRLRLTGRPDRMVQTDGTLIPEEWKSARKPSPSHVAQLGVYFLLIEDQLRVRPPHGFIVTGDGNRHLIENTAEMRGWVMELAGQLRAARANPGVPIQVNPFPGQCRRCGQRENCGQARL
ncbi:CRISPR-associated protein Cas4 [Paludisphaera borealis]|uniref:RecB family exonuclease n=1 Tax=Paludisphaera borealis TaxID=1387353 RepID=A0A1U7CZF7_9BACT|nr:PD-(D/E)XK nuclease family protein [Paludisphaera borealis]APW64315.1 RecB family exonuclease [Paludisphaera borealis]